MRRRVLDASAHDRLRYVRAARLEVDLRNFPDFLIVGPQRTGTTWLHAHLRFHPEIFLSEPKELFFFSSLKPPRGKRFRSDDLDFYLRFFRDPLWRWLVKNTITLWKFRVPYRPKVRGEATASYAALDRDVIDDIVTLNPDVKVVFMIRNPIDRAWSHAKKDLVRKTRRRVEDVPDEEFQAFFSDPYQLRCSRYVENHDNWAACVRPGNLFVRTFDDIQSRPEALLLDLLTFLGVASSPRFIAADVRRSVNPTVATRIPEKHRRFLEELLAHDILKVRDRFGISWQSDA